MNSAAIFILLAGIGVGVALSLVAAWAAHRLTRTLPEPAQPAQPLPGVTVRDSTMGEFDAVRRSA